MIRHFLSRQFLTFVLTGALAACVNFGARLLYNQWVDFSMAVVLAYLTGMIVAFLLARLFVFRQGTQSLPRSLCFFVLVNGVAFAQTWVISVALYDMLPLMGMNHFVPEIAHAVGVTVPVFTSYVGHKKFSFR